MAKAPRGVRLLAAFFVFGAMMSGLACVSLLVPEGGLDRIWRLNPRAHAELSRLGIWAIALMGVVCAACALAARGLLRQSRRGYYLALGVLAVNLLGDATSAAVSGDWRTLVGLPIGGALMAYLLRPRVRVLFLKSSGG